MATCSHDDNNDRSFVHFFASLVCHTARGITDDYVLLFSEMHKFLRHSREKYSPLRRLCYL